MKISSVALLALATGASAFVTPGKTTQRMRSLKMSTTEGDEIANLKAQAAKMREEANKLTESLGKSIVQEDKVRVKESISTDEMKTLTADINFEQGDAQAQSMQLDALKASGNLKMWKMAGSDNNEMRPYAVSLRALENGTGGKITSSALGMSGEGDVAMDDFKYSTLGVTAGCSVLGVAALALLPENVGATVCYLVALIPVLWLGIGSTAPGLIAELISNIKGTADDQEKRLDRVCRHEAGHFMCGYLCGLPIKGYSMLDSGVPCVEFHPSSDGPVTGRTFDSEEIAALSVVAMSGSAAEIIGLGNAKGGENDLIELEGLFRRASQPISPQKQQDLTRWGALMAFKLLDQNIAKFEELVQAFKEQKSVSECVSILESR